MLVDPLLWGINEKCFYYVIEATFFLTENDGKTWFSIRKIILISKRHAEHLLAGQNTQHTSKWSKKRRRNSIFKAANKLSSELVCLSKYKTNKKQFARAEYVNLCNIISCKDLFYQNDEYLSTFIKH